MTDNESKIVLLKWHPDSDKFQPIESDGEMDEGVFLELLPDTQQWKYFYIKGASLIDRRTALRAANGISKTGYVHSKDNIRYGVEHKLLEEQGPYDDLSDDLKKSQRSWYGGEPKKF